MLAYHFFRMEKRPNPELLEHDRKRRIEIKCMELQVRDIEFVFSFALQSTKPSDILCKCSRIASLKS